MIDAENRRRYSFLFESSIEVYDLPLIQTIFYQKDKHAMDYCRSRRFITLIIPFGDPDGLLQNRIMLKNNLVSYIKMFSDFYGGSVKEKGNFLTSILEVVRQKSEIPILKIEELYPIAFIENIFRFCNAETRHCGIVYTAKISGFDQNIVRRSFDDEIYFSNPHNKVLLDIAKESITKYENDGYWNAEINYARNIEIAHVKEKKREFLKDKNIEIEDYYNFKKKIVTDIKKFNPKNILDIACGDDDIIYDFLSISENIRVFANDIAFAYMEDYHFKKIDHLKINFSNLNALNTSFKKNAFDIVFCKNLLHHIPRQKLTDFVSHGMRICKKMVLVEILSPDEQNKEGKIIHEEFYDKILNETNKKNYLKSSEIELLFDDYSIISSEIISTGNGKYKYMWISKHE